MASGGGTAAERDEDDGEKAVMISQGSTSVMDRASAFVDKHLTFFRTLPILVGGLGLAIVLRHLNQRMFSRFRRVSDIPIAYLESNKRLYGVVPSTEWDSVNVWHVPVGKRLLRFGNRPPIGCPKDELLRIKFAGVSLGQSAELEGWLNSRLLEREVWFTLLHPQGKRTVECAVFAKEKGIFGKKYCVNASLVAEGLGTTTEAQGFSTPEARDKFTDLLSKREQFAKTAGNGMWEGSEYESWWAKTKRFFRRGRQK